MWVRQVIFEGMLKEIIRIAQENGVQFGSIQIIDSVDSIANVNTAKDKKIKKKEKNSMTRMHTGEPSINVNVKQKAEKKLNRQNIIFGYKVHVSLNAEAGLITSL